MKHIPLIESFVSKLELLHRIQNFKKYLQFTQVMMTMFTIVIIL